MERYACAPQEISVPFFTRFFFVIVDETFFVMTSSEHKSGFSAQALILFRVFQLVSSQPEVIKTRLLPPNSAGEDPSDGRSNLVILQQYCVALLGTAFQHVQK
jgi:exportin-1